MRPGGENPINRGERAPTRSRKVRACASDVNGLTDVDEKSRNRARSRFYRGTRIARRYVTPTSASRSRIPCTDCRWRDPPPPGRLARRSSLTITSSISCMTHGTQLLARNCRLIGVTSGKFHCVLARRDGKLTQLWRNPRKFQHDRWNIREVHFPRRKITYIHYLTRSLSICKSIITCPKLYYFFNDSILNISHFIFIAQKK